MTWIIGAGFAVFAILGLMSAVHAVMSVRTAQGTIAWAVSLVAFPIVTVPLYWVFGRNRFYGYVRSRRACEPAFVDIERQLGSKAAEFGAREGIERPSLSVYEHLAEMPFTRGNSARLLVDGKETFEAIFEVVAQAERYVLVQFYIVRDDELGRALADCLIERARAGVRVYFLYDEIGSHALPNDYPYRLRQAGVNVCAFDSTRGWLNRFQLNFRNHRKIVVVDGRTAFVGGYNVGNEYLGASRRFGRWRDTHLRFDGPAAVAAQFSFAQDWHWAGGTLPDVDWSLVKSEGDINMLVLTSGPADDMETCGLMFSHAIHTARHRLWIASPYFVPDESIMGALKVASLKGVDVRIMLPDKPDHKLVYLASFASIPSAGSAGVKFYRYEAGFLHQKVMLVDDHFACIGTANLDNRSFRLNFEISVLSYDRTFADEVRRMLEADFADCRDATNDDYSARPIWFRVMVRVANLMAPVL